LSQPGETPPDNPDINVTTRPEATTIATLFAVKTGIVTLTNTTATAIAARTTTIPIDEMPIEVPINNRPPQIIGFTLSPSSPVLSGTTLSIQVNVNRNGHRIDDFQWIVGLGEGSITAGQGNPFITYQAPNEPGTYDITVQLEYGDGLFVEGSTTVEVITEPTTIEATVEVTTKPTTESTIEPTPIPTPDAVVIALNGLNLRSGPGTNYNVIGSLSNGEILGVQGHATAGSDEWIQIVSVNRNTVRGWVAAGPPYTEVNIDLSAIPLVTSPPPPPPTPTPIITTPTPVYAAPKPTSPDDGHGAFGTFPPLTWEWAGELGDNEYFEVRVWHESVTTYRPSLGWVKAPAFDYNISDERHGKYFWSVVITTDRPDNVRFKDWYRPDAWPYPVWEHKPEIEVETWQTLSPESEIRFFNFTPSGQTSGSGSAVSNPSPGTGINDD
jgi:uncharacterized protein YraI